jgi:hypothetical protein
MTGKFSVKKYMEEVEKLNIEFLNYLLFEEESPDKELNKLNSWKQKIVLSRYINN